MIDANSVGDFAEQLMMQEQLAQSSQGYSEYPQTTPSYIPTGVHQQAPDISQVEVPSSFIQGLVENKEESNTAPPQVPTALEEQSDIITLLSEVRSLLSEVKEVLTEITTVGSGIGAPAPKPTKLTKEKEVDELLSSIMKKRKKALQ